MKVRLEAKLIAPEGERVLVSTFDLPAPPTAGLTILGRGWEVSVDAVSYATETGEYRASASTHAPPGMALADLVRRFEMEGWRAMAR